MAPPDEFSPTSEAMIRWMEETLSSVSDDEQAWLRRLLNILRSEDEVEIDQIQNVISRTESRIALHKATKRKKAKSPTGREKSTIGNF